jgi:hypothetical protein
MHRARSYTHLSDASGSPLPKHLHREDELDDWIPLARKDSRQRTVRPVGGSAGNG